MNKQIIRRIDYMIRHQTAIFVTLATFEFLHSVKNISKINHTFLTMAVYRLLIINIFLKRCHLMAVISYTGV